MKFGELEGSYHHKFPASVREKPLVTAGKKSNGVTEERTIREKLEK